MSWARSSSKTEGSPSSSPKSSSTDAGLGSASGGGRNRDSCPQVSWPAASARGRSHAGRSSGASIDGVDDRLWCPAAEAVTAASPQFHVDVEVLPDQRGQVGRRSYGT